MIVGYSYIQLFWCSGTASLERYGPSTDDHSFHHPKETLTFLASIDHR